MGHCVLVFMLSIYLSHHQEANAKQTVNVTINTPNKESVPTPSFQLYINAIIRTLSGTDFINQTRAYMEDRRKKNLTELDAELTDYELDEMTKLFRNFMRNRYDGNKLQKQLNYVKKREIDALRRRIIPRKKHAKPGFQDPDHLNISHIEYSADDFKQMLVAAREHKLKMQKLREENYKLYEMEKKFLEKQKLRHYNNDADRKKEIERIRKLKMEKSKIELESPLENKEAQAIWEKLDHLPKNEFNPKTFFALHDIDGNHLLDVHEIAALMNSEISIRFPTDVKFDPEEKQKAVEKLKEYTYNTVDRNKDGYIELEEFLDSIEKSKEAARNKIEAFDASDNIKDEEFEEFEKKRIMEIRDQIARGETPRGYNYSDVPLPEGVFINETHIKYKDVLLKIDDRSKEEREKSMKQNQMKKKFLQEQRLAHIKDPVERQRVEQEINMELKKQFPMNTPLGLQQLQKTWEEQDDKKDEEFDAQQFFHLHDIDSDGYLNKQEVRLLLITELESAYAEYNKTFDPLVMSDDLERMREEAMAKGDKDGDQKLSIEEFMDSVERNRKNAGNTEVRNKNLQFEKYWANMYGEAKFTEEEYEEFKNKKIKEIRQMILDGKIPEDFNYTDIPQLHGDYINQTHIRA